MANNTTSGTNPKFMVCGFNISNDGKRLDMVCHDYRPNTLEEALKVGHELTRDYVYIAFKVIRLEEDYAP
jgi:hypothetical protein